MSNLYLYCLVGYVPSFGSDNYYHKGFGFGFGDPKKINQKIV